MADYEQSKLHELNRNYIRSVRECDVRWFEAHLAEDFLNTNPDGTLVDKSAFLDQIARGSSVKDLQAHDVRIRVFGDFAIIHARTTYTKSDGTIGTGRYTDDWQLENGTWRCVSAHVTRA